MLFKLAALKCVWEKDCDSHAYTGRRSHTRYSFEFFRFDEFKSDPFYTDDQFESPFSSISWERPMCWAMNVVFLQRWKSMQQFLFTLNCTFEASLNQDISHHRICPFIFALSLFLNRIIRLQQNHQTKSNRLHRAHIIIEVACMCENIVHICIDTSM